MHVVCNVFSLVNVARTSKKLGRPGQGAINLVAGFQARSQKFAMEAVLGVWGQSRYGLGGWG